MGKQARIKQERREQGRCPVKNCGQPVSPASEFDLCKECTRIVNVVLFALPRIKVNQPPVVPVQKSKIILPGHSVQVGKAPPRIIR